MRLWPRAIYEWGSTAGERTESLACDRVLADPDHTLFRAVDVNAPAPALFRWLCQLRAAPYSYDMLDNLGRRSPQTLTPGLEQLAEGQRVMTIFRLVEFEPDRSITVFSKSRIFGRVAGTYRVEPIAAVRSRLLVKLLVALSPAGRLADAPDPAAGRSRDDAPSAAQPEGAGRAERLRRRWRRGCQCRRRAASGDASRSYARLSAREA
jgi:hypothetical protein